MPVKVYQRIGGEEFVKAFSPTMDLEWTKENVHTIIKIGQYLVKRSDDSLEVIEKEEFEKTYIQVSK